MLCKVPSEIVLGPPKTTFASASSARTTSRTFDSPNRTAFNAHNGDASRNDQYSSKDKSREKLEGEVYKSREPRSGAAFGRRNGKEEGESWSGLRSGKPPSTDDSDRPFRRYGERGFGQGEGENGDNGRPQRGFENYRREGDDAGTPRRNGMGRGNRPSWYNDDNNQENDPPENTRDNTRTRDWRDGGDRNNRRGPERDWDRNRRVEQDPEWMLEPDTEEKKQAHTAEDMEQWKASMRAGKGSADIGASSKSSAAKNEAATTPAAKLDISLGLDPSLDKFFGLWNEPKAVNGASPDQGAEQQLKPEAGRLNAPKSSRFTGFFSPKTEVQPQQPAPPPVDVSSLADVAASNEDKAGFQRILQMLGGGGNTSTAAPKTSSNHASSGEPINLLQAFSSKAPTASQKTRTPPREHNPTQPPASPPILSPRSRRSITIENLLGNGPQSPREVPHTQISESEFLLSLMKPKSTETRQMAPPSQRIPTSNAPGILPHPNLMSQQMNHSSHQAQDQPLHLNSYDNLRPENPDPRDKLNPNAPWNSTSIHRQLRERRESIPGLFDDFELRQPQMNAPSQFNLPPGLHRPPGFDQFPSGYSQHLQQQQQQLQQHQQQRHNVIAPPPGFQNPNQPQNPNARNPNPFPPGLIPNLSNLNIGGAPERATTMPPFMRGMGPAPGPGAMPPPGFMGMGIPPPGFPPLQDEARMMYGGVPRGGMVDMFGEAGVYGVGNGNGNGGGSGRGGFGPGQGGFGFKRE